jgi:hypothetical protein
LSHFDGSLELEQNGLRDKDLAGLGTEITNLGLEQLNLLAWAAAPHLQEAVDYRVEIDVVLVRHCKIRSTLLAEIMARTKVKALVVTGGTPAACPREKKKLGKKRQARRVIRE